MASVNKHKPETNFGVREYQWSVDDREYTNNYSTLIYQSSDMGLIGRKDFVIVGFI